MTVLRVEQVDLFPLRIAYPEDQPSRLALHVDDARAGGKLEGGGGPAIRGFLAQARDATHHQRNHR